MNYEQNTLHLGLTYDQYAAECIKGKYLRSTGLKPLLKSAMHYKVSIEKEKPDSDALRVGKLVHSLFENPEKFLDTYKVEPEFIGKTLDGKPSTRSGEAKAMRAAWYADLPKDALVVYPEDLVMVQVLAKNINNCAEIKGLLKGSTRESTIFTKDPETGVPIACRPDLIASRGHVIDFKTTIDATPGYMIPQILRRGKMSQHYILNAAHYAHCLKVSGVGNGDNFVIIAIDKEIWDFQIYPLDIGWLGVGDQWRQVATKRYADALEKGIFEGFKNKIVATDLPEWAPVPGNEYDE